MKLKYTDLKPRRNRDSSVHNQFKSVESCVKLKLCSTKQPQMLHPTSLTPSLCIDLWVSLQRAVARGQNFSGLHWTYIHKEAMQEQPTKSIVWSPVPLSKTQHTSMNIWFNHAFIPLEWRVDTTGLNLGHRTVWGASLKFLWLFVKYPFIQVNKQMLGPILNREVVDSD